MEPLITPVMLASTGIRIADDEVDAFLEHLNDQLTERIGEAITESLDPAQLDELSKLEETATDEELGEWMSKNVTDLDDIIADEIEILLGDAVENRGAINDIQED